MKKSETVAIGQFTFHIAKLPSREADAILFRLLKILGPSAVKLLEKTSLAQLQAGQFGEGWEEALTSLLAQLDPAELGTLRDLLMPCTTIDLVGTLTNGTATIAAVSLDSQYDTMLADYPAVRAQWLFQAAKVNFASFFSVGQTESPTAQAPAAS